MRCLCLVRAALLLLFLPVAGAHAQQDQQASSPQDVTESKPDSLDAELPSTGEDQEPGVSETSGIGQKKTFRGLFGDKPRNHQGRHALDVTVSAFGAYDDNISGGVTGGFVDPRLAVSGSYTGVNMGLDYSSRGRRASFTAAGSSAMSYYPSYGDNFISSYGGGVGVSVPVGRSGTLRASQTVSYSPFFRFSPVAVLPGMIPADVTVIAQTRNFDVGNFDALSYATSVELSRAISRRASIQGFYSSAITNFSNQPFDLREQRVGARVVRSLTRYAGVRLGYALRRGRYSLESESPSRVSHDIDMGVDYARPLSFSRRTMFRLSTGSSVVMPNEKAVAAPGSPQEARHAFATGTVTLVHEIGRTWNAALSLQRAIQFMEGFAEPVLSTATILGVHGYLNRRIDVTLNGSYSRGAVGVATRDSDFATTAVTAQLRTALTRRFAVYVEPLYYRYDFGPAAELPAGVPPLLDRRGVRFGLMTSLPLN
jgi:hypothetical protein